MLFKKTLTGERLLHSLFIVTYHRLELLTDAFKFQNHYHYFIIFIDCDISIFYWILLVLNIQVEAFI